MKKLPIKDLKKVIEYLYPHEERHYMECLANLQESDESDGTIKRHIFPSIIRLKEWLDDQQR
jgi:hypothetical protein